ncbi:hypothetical protein [Leptospira noguchii]|uniref:hypothetical protein n=1 Tax=Leptospira noguchii TaxID=28182 RepID=UPI001FB6AC0B|nr:hypothetical protein [Leptospira noguchii]UOG30324.1 hypothetical protein MAL06_17365 [Leptospira noguchii]
MERKRTTQRLASMVARRVVSHFNYKICELRRRPVGSRCIEFIIRPNFLTSNSRYIRIVEKLILYLFLFYRNGRLKQLIVAMGFFNNSIE